MEKGSHPSPYPNPKDNDKRWYARMAMFLLTSCLILGFQYSLICRFYGYGYGSSDRSTKSRSPDFSHLSKHCAHIPPPSSSSFIDRQNTLARTLRASGASAYIAEPGASAAYFANISSSHWGLSERPLLLIISPDVDTDDNVHAKVSILTPAFEASRAKRLFIPSASQVNYPAWPEDANPYSVAISTLPHLEQGDIFVDGAVRTFITDGLQSAAPGSSVLSAPVEIKRLRERKSKEELEILKCVNEATLLALRAARKLMYVGMRESEARAFMQNALRAIGLDNGGALTLFGENAALPHGTGSDRVLGNRDFILIDTFASLHGYWSDLTRTFALGQSIVPAKHLEIWNFVHSAQAEALRAARNGTVTASVDNAAREIISEAGFGEYFTHRLGHGIGLEVHESPYLRGGSDDIILTGHTFSDEPGIYIEGKVGVRLEDCFYIDEDGKAVYFTEGVGGPAISPWSP